MSKRNIGILVLISVIIVALIGLTIYLVNQQQTIQSHADVPTTNVFPSSQPLSNAQATTPTTAACTTPGAVTNVTVVYPYTDTAGKSYFDQANCTWNALSGIASYLVKITEVNSGTVIQNKTVDNTITNFVFPVTQGKRYECDVSGTNSCGQTGPAGSDTALCQVDGTFPTATPSASIFPTTTIVPTVPLPTAIPSPGQLPKSGSTGTTILIGVVGAAFVVVGGALLFGL